MKFSSKILKCQLSPVRKFNPCADQAVAAGRTIYHLNIGQPDVKTPESFYQAVREFREPTLEYAPASGLPAYIDAVRGYYAKLGVKLEREDILATSGGGEALEFIMACILDDGDELLVPEPFYANYNTFTFMSGGVIHPIPTSADNGYRFADRKLIESQINERTRAILVTNPGNPTGLVLTHEEMRVIADVVKEHDLFLVADEVYREFIYDDEPMGTFCEMEDIKDHVIVVDSISKRFSACGARVGCVVTRNKELQAALLKFCQSRLSVATIDQIGAAALYTVDPAFFRQSKEEYRRRRDTVISKLRKIPGVVVEEPMGAFYVMASLPVDDADKFQYWLLENFDHQGDTVMFAPGAPFYETPGKGINEVRIAYVLKQEDLERAMDVLAFGISEYQRKVMKITPAPVG